MNETQLKECVAKRAQTEVDAAWRVFKAALAVALGAFKDGANVNLDGEKAILERALAQIRNGTTSDKLPRVLWDVREKRILNEILQTMDALQRTRAALGYEPEETPEGGR